MHGTAQHARVVVACLLHESLEGRTCASCENDAECLEDASDLIGDFDPHPDELSSCSQHGPNCVALKALDANLAVPADLHYLSQAIRIVLVGLVDLPAHCRLGMSCIETDHGQAHLLQRMPVPCAQRSAFQSDPDSIRRLRPDNFSDRLGC